MGFKSIGKVIKKGLGVVGKVGGVIGIPGIQLINVVMDSIEDRDLTPNQRVTMLNARALVKEKEAEIVIRTEEKFAEVAAEFHGQAQLTLRKALASSDPFVRRVTPAFLWTACLMAFTNYVVIAIANIFLVRQGIEPVEPVEIPWQVWAVVLGWFGVWRPLRTNEKKHGVAS